jgi:hypothetical protein
MTLSETSALGREADFDYTTSNFLNPTHVCVHISGFTDVIGEFITVNNNVGCEITVLDNGFMRGTKIVKSPTC